MPDREKVIKGLEEISDYFFDIYRKEKNGYSPAQEYCNVAEDALALLKEQVWHLLKEDADGLIHGLPGDDGQYLMTDGEDMWIDDYVDGVDDGVWLDSGRDIREIKAWMYMPEPPKQEGL